MNYDKTFKERAVKLSYQRSTILSATKELDISDSALKKWHKDYKEYGRQLAKLCFAEEPRQSVAA